MMEKIEGLPLLILKGAFAYDPSFMQRLCSELDLKREMVVIAGQERLPDRMVDFRSDPGLSYGYSGSRKRGLPWTPALSEIKAKVEELCGERFNACLANLYPDGKSSMGWHTDDERDLAKGSAIASVSFGAARDFCVKRADAKGKGASRAVLLESGDLALMQRGMQEEWLHCVPKRAGVAAARLSLTFRQMAKPSGSFKGF